MLFLTDHYLQFGDHISLLLNGANGRETNKQPNKCGQFLSVFVFTHGLTLIKPKKAETYCGFHQLYQYCEWNGCCGCAPISTLNKLTSDQIHFPF